MLEIVHALVVTLSLTGEIKTTLYPAPSFDACKASVRAFVNEPLPKGLRDAHMTCVVTKIDSFRGTRPA